MRDLLCHRIVRQRSLIRVPLLFELHRAKEEGGGNYSEY